jgi:hypothetical protein
VQVGKKNPSQPEVQSLDQAVNNLVKGLKRDLHKRYGRVDYSKLRKAGYSDQLLTKLQQA